MRLQKIIFPDSAKCSEEDLYYHTDRSVGDSNIKGRPAGLQEQSADLQEQFIDLKEGAKISFDTYFNAFSIEKWKKYTIVDNVSLKLKVSGKLKITLFQKELREKRKTTNVENTYIQNSDIESTVIETIISEAIVETEDADSFVFNYTTERNRGIYAFQIEALEEKCRFWGGEYYTVLEQSKLNDTKIGICICTYKREKFIEKNLKLLNKEIFDDKALSISNNLEIFIADNGNSLDIDRLQSDHTHIYPNRNLGGSGGFTRTLIEIYRNNTQFGITHVLLMDDDVIIEPETINRTYNILTLLKAEYRDAFIGGAMLRLDKPYIQNESGAIWGGGIWQTLKSNLDMRECINCLANEEEENPEYVGWWYCCLPMSIVNENNLPLPLFIRCDDVEYSLRNMRQLILINGICVWHVAFENKFAFYLEYYSTRNKLIINSFHCRWYRPRMLNREILSRCVQELMFYRYENAELYLQGVLDFLKGPDWLMSQNGEKLHGEVLSKGYKEQTLSILEDAENIRFNMESYNRSHGLIESRKNKIKRYLTFNGLPLPADGDNCVPMSQAVTSQSLQSYRKKRVLHYNESNRTGFVTKRSVYKSVIYIIKMLLVMCKASLRFKKVQEDYRSKAMELRSLKLWDTLLKAENNEEESKCTC